jgi:hypothetical protein
MGKVHFIRGLGGILVTLGTLLPIICFKIRRAWNKGNLGNLQNIALTENNTE